MAKSAAKPKARGAKAESDGGIEVAADFIKSHVEKLLLEGGMDQEHASRCVQEIDAEILKAVGEECGIDDKSQQTGEEAGQNEEAGAEADGEQAEQHPKKGMAAIGGGKLIKFLWDHKDEIQQVVQKLADIFLLKNGTQTAGQDQSTQSSGGNV